MLAVTGQQKRWSTPHREPEVEEVLMRELDVPRIVATVLINRGYREPREAHRFLNPSLEDLHDPKLLPDFESAAGAVLGARERGEKILVHGDYDVDGVSSASLLTRFLRKVGVDVIPFVPHRMTDGYGLARRAIDLAAKEGAKLILTCDCGSTANDEIDYANEIGIRVVVTDHHEMGERIPNAVAVVNPIRGGYPFNRLCGAGVAFKFCAGLTSELNLDPLHFYRAYLDLAVLGTIADIVDLTDENRIIARYGLMQLAQSKKLGLRKLLATSGCDKYGVKLNAGHVGFRIGPRLNAAGRMEDADDALRLLLTEDESEASNLALKLEGLNEFRQNEERAAFDDAIRMIEENNLESDRVIVLTSENWPRGLIGLVAGKIKERYGRPAVVMSVDGDSAHGSARSIRNFSLKQAFDDLRSLLVSGGGHQMAGGLQIRTENIDEFSQSMNRLADQILTEEDLIPEVSADSEIEVRDADFSAALALEQIEPCGIANPNPIFITKGLSLVEGRETRTGGHWQAKFRSDAGDFVRCIGFGIAQEMAEARIGDRFDIAYNLGIDEYNGDRNLKWTIKDIKPSIG